jgi:hypothetical protein
MDQRIIDLESTTFTGGNLIQTAGSTTKSQIKLVLDFSPNNGVDKSSLTEDIQEFLVSVFNLTKDDYVFDSVYVSTLSMQW